MRLLSGFVWLWPSRTEGFGLPILEAMACGVPVVAADTGAARDLVLDGGGALVPVDDPIAMADALCEILELSPEAWAARSEQARKKALACNWDDAVDHFEAALLAAVDGAGDDGWPSK